MILLRYCPYTFQLESIVRWGKLQIQCFIFLSILGCPEILVNIFKRGSSSTSRMCVYLSGSQKSLKIVGCWLILINVFYNSELQLDSVQYYPQIVQYCMILVKLGWYCLMLKGIIRYWHLGKILEIDYVVVYLQYFVLMSITSSCSCITVIRAPLKLTHMKNR